MNSRVFTNYYVWGIKALVFIIPFLSVWISSSMYFPYITGRNFAFRILVELALVLWVALALLNKNYRPKMSPIAWAVVAFAGIVGIANLAGIDFFNSFWSRFERMEGYLMILHLTAYFFILTNVFRTKKEWLTLFNLVLIAGVLVGGYGILQVLGIKEAIQGGDVRIDGTIGNPTYLAAYLTLVIALSLVLFFNAQKKWQKYFYGGAVAFSFFVMFFTASRGATLAMMISVPLFLALYIFLFRKSVEPKEKLFRKIAIGFLAAMVLLPTAIWLLRDTSTIQESAVLSRVTSVSFQERTIRARFQIWGIAWRAFLERPVLGWGQENFLVAFSKYFDPRLYDQEPWFDRPHNIVFEWLINAGVLGLAAYLALFVTLFWGIGKLLKRGDIGKKEGIVLSVVPITYFLQNFFVFDNFNTYILFFGILAYVHALLVRKETEESGDAGGMASLWALTVGIIIIGIIMYFINFRPLAQAQGIIKAFQATTDTVDPVGKTLAAFKNTIGLNAFGEAEALEQLTRTAGLLAGQNSIPAQVKIPFLQYAITELEQYLKENPKNIRLHLMLANLYQSARGLNANLVLAARDELKKAMDLSPTKQQILYLMADNYLITSEVDKAIELIKRAVDLEPANREAQVNMAVVAAIAGRNDLIKQATENLKQIKDTSLEKPSNALWAYAVDLKKIADIYLSFNQKQNARAVYRLMEPLAIEAKEKGYTEDYAGLLKDVRDDLGI